MIGFKAREEAESAAKEEARRRGVNLKENQFIVIRTWAQDRVSIDVFDHMDEAWKFAEDPTNRTPISNIYLLSTNPQHGLLTLVNGQLKDVL